jgi:hypothetical protein
MRRAILALLVGMLIGPLSTNASDPAIMVVPGTSLGIVPQGGASGGDALYLNSGDIIGPRNLQGGGPGGAPFDIGAGSTQDPSSLSLQYDIGRDTLIWDGHKHLVARFGPGGIVFYKRPRIVVARPRH